MVYINFDTMPAVKEDFKRTKEPLKLIKSMELMTGKNISPASTLIVLDEIQECNEALNSLKYFCEDAPEYAVVCAGSLLGVALNRTGASFPVGKVDFMTLYPVSFAEYLRAADAQALSFLSDDRRGDGCARGVAPAADRCLQVVSCVRRNARGGKCLHRHSFVGGSKGGSGCYPPVLFP